MRVEFPLIIEHLMLLLRKEQKKFRYRTSGRKGQVTIVACANAAGQVIPPMINYDAKNLQHAWTKGEVPGTKYGLSEKGWINCELFEGWLAEHFIQHAVSSRPLLLLLDGYSTHFQPRLCGLLGSMMSSCFACLHIQLTSPNLLTVG